MKAGIIEKIAGEITVSCSPGKTMRKWRETFHISQRELAEKVRVSPSVIADYESGRRAAPRVSTVKRIVEAIVSIDEGRGSSIIRQYSPAERLEAILDMKELPEGLGAKKLVRALDGKVLAYNEGMKREIFGYTVLDSPRAILTISAQDYIRVYGRTSERALIFTGVKFGRSPMVAVRSHPMKPALVVLHRPKRVDALSLALSEVERIPLVASDMELEKLLNVLRGI
jgi:putative transcriptional regulator